MLKRGDALWGGGGRKAILAAEGEGRWKMSRKVGRRNGCLEAFDRPTQKQIMRDV